MMEVFRKLVLGTVQFGLDYGINNPTGKISQKEINEILIFGKNNGIEYLDTANAYGDALNTIGEFHSIHSSINFKIIGKYSKTLEGVGHQIERELRVLKRPKYDYYLLHSFSNLSDHKLMDELLELKKVGKIGKLGVSLYTNEEVEAVMALPYVEVIQVPFNAFDNNKLKGALLKKIKSLGKEVHVRSVFLQGLFFKDIGTFPEKLTPLVKPIQKLRTLAKLYNVEFEKLIFSYPFAFPYIDKVVFGVDSLVHLQKNMENIVSLESDLVRSIHEEIMINDLNLLSPKNW